MTFATDMFSYLNTHSQQIGIPSNISINYIPVDKLNCVAVYDTGGFSTDRYHGSDAGDMPTVQIRLRNQSSKIAYEQINAIYRAFDDKTNVILNDVLYPFIFSPNPPVYLGELDVQLHGKAHEYTLNLYSRKMRS